MNINVLHLPYGLPMIDICQGLRKKGIKASSLHFFQNRYDFKPDICANLDQLTKTEALIQKRNLLQNCMQQFDLFHFHFGETFLPNKQDLQQLKEAGKKIVVHHHGSEVRSLSKARKYNNPYVKVKPEWTDERIHQNLQMLSSYVNHAIVPDYELYPYITPYYRNIHVIQNAVQMDQYTPSFPSRVKKMPLVVHAPTHRDLKGTDYVLSAVRELKNEGIPFQFQLLEHMTEKEVKAAMKQSDIVIDQLRIGSYGFVAIEGMAFGKPVISFIRPDLVTTFPSGLPICNANPLTIKEKLRDLLLNPVKRYDLGQKGRQYAMQFHDIHKQVEKYIRIYQSI